MLLTYSSSLSYARARKMLRWAQQTSVKNWFSNAIKLLKSVRTLSGVCFKIRQPKPNYPSAVDEKTEIFSEFSHREEKKDVSCTCVNATLISKMTCDMRKKTDSS